MTKKDHELVSLAQGGEKAAFVDIVAKYQATVTGITLGILGDFQASEDAAQDAFVTAWKKIGTLQNPDKLRPWLGRIARHTALMHLRKVQPVSGGDLEKTEDVSPSPDEVVARQEDRSLVLHELHKLPEKLRLPLVLFYREEKSIRAVSDSLELTPDVVKKRLAEGRGLLRRRVARLLDPVIRRTSPDTVFTVTVAGLIGAMLKPSAMAATACSGTYTTTAVTTTKTTLSSMLAVALFLPGGFALHRAMNDAPRSDTPMKEASSPTASKRAFLPNAETPLVAGWKALQDQFLTGGQDYHGLFREIEAMENSLEREAYKSLCLAAWAESAPFEALAFLSSLESYHDERQRFLREWVRLDPGPAIAEIEKGGFWSKGEPDPDVLLDLAEGDPKHLMKVFTFFTAHVDAVDYLERAMARLAERNFDKALAAFEESSDSFRVKGSAVRGLVRVWAQQSPDEAKAWLLKRMSQEKVDQFLMDPLLAGVALTNHGLALDLLSDYLAEGKRGNTGKAFKILARQDLVATARWLQKNEATEGFGIEGRRRALAMELNYRLGEEGVSALQSWENQGVLGDLVDAFGKERDQTQVPRKVLTDAWSWLRSKPDSPTHQALLVNQIVPSLAQVSPQAVISLIDEVEDNTLQAVLREAAVDGLDRNLARNSRFIEQQERPWQEVLTSQFLKSPYFFPSDDLEFWKRQFEEMPPQSQAKLHHMLGGSLAERDPADAFAWADSLNDAEARNDVLGSVFYEWSLTDPESAHSELNSLQSDSAHSAATLGYLTGMAKSDPDTVLQWLENHHLVETSNFDRTASRLLQEVSKHDPYTAREWAQKMNLTEHLR